MFNYYYKCLIIILLMQRCWSLPPLSNRNNYVVLAEEKSFFQPCSPEDDGGNTNVEDFLELNLIHEFDDDMETLITSGNITMKVGIPLGVILELDLEVFLWKRGRWEKTVYSIRRDDFCIAAFDPVEFWYPLTNQIRKEDRICPPEKGTIYHLDRLANRVELNNIEAFDVEGDYKVVAHFVAGEFRSCITAYANVWKN